VDGGTEVLVTMRQTVAAVEAESQATYDDELK
jgi:hypothetical protein